MSDFENNLDSLNGVGIKQLEELMKKTRNAIKEKEQEALSKREEDFADELNPYEESLKAVENELKADMDAIDAQIELLRTSKKTKQLASQDEITKILVDYNEKRKELGLPIKTLRTLKTGTTGVTRNRTGESHKYDIDWVDGSETEVSIMIDKNPEWAFTINTADGLHVADVEKAMKDFGIDTRGGGMCRGVINRVRKLKLSKRNVNQEKASA